MNDTRITATCVDPQERKVYSVKISSALKDAADIIGCDLIQLHYIPLAVAGRTAYTGFICDEEAQLKDGLKGFSIIGQPETFQLFLGKVLFVTMRRNGTRLRDSTITPDELRSIVRWV